jgi:cytochrome c oxidase subunit III
MWVFLATEVMFFGALFTSYIVYRSIYSLALAEVSRQLDIVLGTTNTVVLICSSFTMATAVYYAQTGRRRMILLFLLLTVLLGLVFIGIKFYEYYHKFVEHLVPGSSFSFPGPYTREAEMFFTLYFAMTAFAKALLVALFFMHLRYSLRLMRIVVVAGLYWLAIMIALTMSDFLTRGWLHFR